MSILDKTLSSKKNLGFSASKIKQGVIGKAQENEISLKKDERLLRDKRLLI